LELIQTKRLQVEQILVAVVVEHLMDVQEVAQQVEAA
jgi:hypothetical protein